MRINADTHPMQHRFGFGVALALSFALVGLSQGCGGALKTADAGGEKGSQSVASEREVSDKEISGSEASGRDGKDEKPDTKKKVDQKRDPAVVDGVDEPVDDAIDVDKRRNDKDSDGAGVATEPEPEPAPGEVEEAVVLTAESDSGGGFELEADSGGSWSRRRAERRARKARAKIAELVGDEAVTGERETASRAETCEQNCDIADAICESKDVICAVASQYRDDQSYRDDCSWAQTHCDEAEAQCRGCQE